MSEQITLLCTFCEKKKKFDIDSFEATSGCLYFCSVQCEDDFAWFECPKSQLPRHVREKEKEREKKE